MGFERSRSCPVDQGRRGSAPPPAEFYDADDFKFDKQCVAGKFNLGATSPPAESFDADEFNFDVENFKFNSDGKKRVSGKFNTDEGDVTTVCSEPPKPSTAAATRTYNNRKCSPKSVHEMLGQISEEQEKENKYNLSLRDDYAVDENKRMASDITEVISNAESGAWPAKCKNTGVIRNPNLVVTGSPDMRRSNTTSVQQQSGKPPPPVSMFRRLFSCGAPEVKESIHDLKEKTSHLKANVKQKKDDTVAEVKGSFGDLGLTVRQVFSPVQNTKTGAVMVKKKVVTKVKKLKGQEVEDEHTDDDENTTDGDEEGLESGSSLADSESESRSSLADSDIESEYDSTDDASEGSDCKQVTGW